MKKLLIVPVGLGLIVAAFLFAGTTTMPSNQQAPPATNASCTIAGSLSGVLSGAQVAALAQSAGFSPTAIDAGTGKPVLVVAVALTKPESGADSQAVQQNVPADQTGRGLWQITPSDDGDLNPVENAQDAYEKFTGKPDGSNPPPDLPGSFKPWTTYPGSITASDWTWAEQGVAQMGQAAGVSCTQKSSGGGTYVAGPQGNVNQVTAIATPAGLAQLQSYKGFPSGQCTFAAAWLYDTEAGGDVTWHGNAAEWWGNAPVGLHTQTPAAGDIIVYGAGGGYSAFGHVGFIVAVNGSNLDVEEMNYLGVNQMDYRWDTTQPSLQARDILGFLHP